MRRSQGTAQSILEQSQAEPPDLVAAQLLLEVLGPDHPLVLPLDQEGVLLHDFSALDFHLARFAPARAAPDLPVDVEPLWRLCRPHRRLIREGEVWRYRFFYLELLAREGKLLPLFWGGFLRLERELASASRLPYYRGGTYALPEALAILRFQMRRELWVTSVFRPYPLTPLQRKPWAEQGRRFAIRYRLRTAQRERKGRFEALVKARHKQGKSVREIARAAVEQELWPYGTPRSTRTCDYDPVLNCERAVYRVLNKLASGRLR